MKELLIFAFALALRGQALDQTSLNGRYHFVQLAIVPSESGQPIQVRTVGGDIVFDGAGTWRLSARGAIGPAAAEFLDATGTYEVSALGIVALAGGAGFGLQTSARLGAAGAVLIGSSTEAHDATNDIFIGVRASDWQDGPPESHLAGNYAGASLLLPDGSIDAITTALVELSADGAGRFTTAVATGQSSNQKNLTIRQTIAGASYSLRADGSGSAAFGNSATLFGGGREIFVSPDGEILLGFSPEAGQREILVAVRRPPSASVAGWTGKWWIDELLADNDIAGAVRLESSLGSLETDGTGRIRLAQRHSAAEPWIDVTAINYAAQSDDGGTQFGPLLWEGRSNLALGSTAFVSAEVGVVGSNYRVHGLLFGVRALAAPAMEVRNAASLAPDTAPIAPSELIVLRGSGLASSRAIAPEGGAIYELNGVKVAIDGIASSLLAVAPDRIDLQAPGGLAGDSAQIVVLHGDTVISDLLVALSVTSPGIFSRDENGSGIAVAWHADQSPVSGDSPAAPGETIEVLVTGLGVSSPLVRSLRAYLSEDLAIVTSIDRQEGMLGASRIWVTVPPTVRGGDTVPLALATATGFTSIAEIPVR